MLLKRVTRLSVLFLVALGTIAGANQSAGQSAGAVQEESNGTSNRPDQFGNTLRKLEETLSENPDDESLRVQAMVAAHRAEIPDAVRKHSLELARRHPYSIRLSATVPIVAHDSPQLLSDIRAILLSESEDGAKAFRSKIIENLGVIELHLATQTLVVERGNTPRINKDLLDTAIGRLEKSKSPSPVALQYLATAYFVSGERKKAIATFREYIDLASQYMRGGSALGVAKTFYGGGAMDEAEQFAEMALELDVESAYRSPVVQHDAHQILGLVALSRGNKAKAEEHLQLSSTPPEEPTFPLLDSPVQGLLTDLTSELLNQGSGDVVADYLDVVEPRWPHMEKLWERYRRRAVGDK